MELFYFDVQTRELLTVDREGELMPDRKAALAEAIMSAGQLIADVLRDGKASAPVSVVIRDERDRTIASVDVVVSVSEYLVEVM